MSTEVFASSFADYDDLWAFYKAISAGKSIEEAKEVGDNGEGKWGAQTAQLRRPMVALPPEDWQHLTKPQGAKVRVFCPGTNRSVICDLEDTMPHKANIKNDCFIDLNPAACAELNLTQPVKQMVTWQWV